MEDEDKQDTEPPKSHSIASDLGIICLILVDGIALISTLMPFAAAWSGYLTNYFGL